MQRATRQTPLSTQNRICYRSSSDWSFIGLITLRNFPRFFFSFILFIYLLLLLFFLFLSPNDLLELICRLFHWSVAKIVIAVWTSWDINGVVPVFFFLLWSYRITALVVRQDETVKKSNLKKRKKKRVWWMVKRVT